jgi:hypothetical protein
VFERLRTTALKGQAAIVLSVAASDAFVIIIIYVEIGKEECFNFCSYINLL